MSIYSRFLLLISKWPVYETRKRMDYGTYLRNLIKGKGPDSKIFPGTVEENSQMLDSLFRLLNNTHGNKYVCSKKKGACGVMFKEVEHILDHSVTEDLKALKYLEKLSRKRSKV